MNSRLNVKKEKKKKKDKKEKVNVTKLGIQNRSHRPRGVVECGTGSEVRK